MIREIDGCERFALDRSVAITVFEFVVEEQAGVLNSAEALEGCSSPDPVSHSFSHHHKNGEIIEVKVRNIWIGGSPNKLTTSYSICETNAHADVSATILCWMQLFLTVAITLIMKAWSSDFTGAYLQEPLLSQHTMFAGGCELLEFGEKAVVSGLIVGICHSAAPWPPPGGKKMCMLYVFSYGLWVSCHFDTMR